MMSRSSASLTNKKNFEWVVLTLLIIAASAIRLHTNFSTKFIPGNNGAYYLVQARSLLENGRLQFVEFPLLFWMEAGLAWIFFHLGHGNIDSSVDLASRLFDSIVPSLSIIPAFALTKRILAKQEKIYLPVLISALSILYFSPLMLTSDFQKNALGVFWLFWLMYWIYRSFKEPCRKNFLVTFLFLILTGLTHYGCISVAVAMVLVNLILRYELRFTLRKFLKVFIGIVVIVAVCFGIVYITSPWRARVFINIPLEIFRNPIIYFILQRKPVISPLDMIDILLVNSAAIISLALFIKNFSTMQTKTRPFILACIILAFFLSSPFLGIDAAQRLYFMSYLPVIPLLPFIYNKVSGRTAKLFLVIPILLIIVFSIFIVAGKGTQSNMNEKLYSELVDAKKVIPVNGNTIIVARHGMEFWSAWIFRTDVIRQEPLTENYWRVYTNVLFLNQKKDKSSFGPAGLYGKPFSEPALPESSRIIFDGKYFNLYQAATPPRDFSIFNEERP